MQYVFLIRSRASGKKYVTRLRLVTYFLPPALERIKNTYCMGQRPFLYLYYIQGALGDENYICCFICVTLLWALHIVIKQQFFFTFILYYTILYYTILCFGATGPRMWNSLQPHLRRDMNFARFKRQLKTLLFGS